MQNRQRRITTDRMNIMQSVVRAGLRLRPMRHGLQIASWNVEGLTEAKIIALQQIMEKQSIDIMCIQETHRKKSDYFTTEENYLFVLSGSSDEGAEWAGVGFYYFALCSERCGEFLPSVISHGLVESQGATRKNCPLFGLRPT